MAHRAGAFLLTDTTYSISYCFAMKRILIIQSRKSLTRAEFERSAYARCAGEGVEFDHASALDIERDWQSPEHLLAGHDGAIIGGSSDFFLHGGIGEEEAERAGAREVLERVRILVEYMLENDFPALGVCFGHQLIAEIRGGNVTHDHAQRKMGTFDVVLNEDGKRDPLFAGMPPVFAGQYAHRDSVTTLPHGATLLGSGESCKYSLLRYGKNIYTMQFHPELACGDLIDAREVAATYLEPGIPIESVVRPSPESASILRRFAEYIPAKTSFISARPALS